MHFDVLRFPCLHKHAMDGGRVKPECGPKDLFVALTQQLSVGRSVR